MFADRTNNTKTDRKRQKAKLQMLCVNLHMSGVRYEVSSVRSLVSRVTCHVSCVTFHRSCVTCHLSCVMCQVSHVTCHLSPVTCNISLTQTAPVTDLPPAKSPAKKHSRLVCKDLKSPKIQYLKVH